jgi:hypothetical protein
MDHRALATAQWSQTGPAYKTRQSRPAHNEGQFLLMETDIWLGWWFVLAQMEKSG